MTVAYSILPEIDRVIGCETAGRSGEILRRIAGLFVGDAPRLNDAQIRLFDEVLLRLAANAESGAKAELARRLAPLANAPRQLIRSLAQDDDALVAGPILVQSPGLSGADLAAIAAAKGQGHLFAISCRKDLDTTLCGLLLSRGNDEVVGNLAGNISARFSQNDYSRLVDRAVRNPALAKKVAARADISDLLLRRLLEGATANVQQWLLAVAKPLMQGLPATAI